MKRYLDDRVQADLARKMVFLTGPRQVGKTTLSRQLIAQRGGQYLNYDIAADRAIAHAELIPLVNLRIAHAARAAFFMFPMLVHQRAEGMGVARLEQVFAFHPQLFDKVQIGEHV